MRAQLGFVCVFLTLTVVLAQISFAMPDRHERNRCRPPNCVPKPRDRQESSGKKIADDEVRIEENALKLESTTTTTTSTTTEKSTEPENIKENDNILNGDSSSSLSSSPSPTPSKVEVVTLNVITPAPDADAGNQNNSLNGDPSPSPTPSKIEFVTQNVITPGPEVGNQTAESTTSTTTASLAAENGTGEIHIPVEVKIIPPSRDELGGLTGHCPKPFKYHNETGMCFIPGQGEHPCGEKMEFVEEPGTVFGYCACKSYDGCDYRPLLHYPSSKGCYHAFEQGPCQSDEWLIPGPSTVPACVKRSCPAGEKTSNWITLDGKCHELGKQGFCSNPLEMLQYEEGKSTPTCSLTLLKPIACLIQSGHRTIILGASALPCGPGQKRTGSGGCGTLVGF